MPLGPRVYSTIVIRPCLAKLLSVVSDASYTFCPRLSTVRLSYTSSPAYARGAGGRSAGRWWGVRFGYRGWICRSSEVAPAMVDVTPFCRVCHQYKARLWSPVWRRPVVIGRRIAGFARDRKSAGIGRSLGRVPEGPACAGTGCPTGWPRSSAFACWWSPPVMETATMPIGCVPTRSAAEGPMVRRLFGGGGSLERTRPLKPIPAPHLLLT